VVKNTAGEEYMPSRRKTAREKMKTPQKASVAVDKRGRVLIPTPKEVDAVIRRIGKGRLITSDQIREHLAKNHDTDLTCPLVTGIFVRMVAEAAEEERMDGIGDIAPWWRVIKGDGSLNPKLPGGVEAQAACLHEEGHSIEPSRGKKPPKVRNFEKALQAL
jgi:hypothetical protein